MKVEDIFFDFGGTLADVREPFHALRRLTATISSGTPGREVRQPGSLRKLIRRFTYPVIAQAFTPVPELHQTLGELKDSGYGLHVLSNNSDLLLYQLRALDLDEGTFETVSWSEEIGLEKPDPRVFEIALQRAGADAGKSVYVGDDLMADVEGARLAGLTPIQVDYRRRAPAVGQITVPRFADLPQAVAALAAG